MGAGAAVEVVVARIAPFDVAVSRPAVESSCRAPAQIVAVSVAAVEDVVAEVAAELVRVSGANSVSLSR